ncbi:hypothetical protein [Lysobacter sp. FW306-1B-D06B]|uniref:hypothetical protein n=1 Tax=Lysobacter sp. FW306-1B-D06B TaxID=3140250 RepID=UPI00314015A3
MLNLTLLAPDLVAAILDDTLPEAGRLHDLAINPPVQWDEQRACLSPHPTSREMRTDEHTKRPRVLPAVVHTHLTTDIAVAVGTGLQA